MKNLSLLILFLSVTFLSSCSTISSTYDFDQSTNFNIYKTYSLHQKGLDKLKINDLDKRRIIASIDREMATKGFLKVNSNADLIVNILASSTQEVSINNDYYGYWYGGISPSTSEYTSGKIIIDIIDDKRNILIWQGVGSGLDVSNTNTKHEKIPEAINKVLTNFPPKAK